MKIFVPCVLLIASSGFLRASIVETISFNLSDLHAGSTLSGTFTLSNSPMVGDTAPVVLSFSDPSDYSSSPLSTTITIDSGTPSGYSVVFSEITFTNLSGTVTPMNTKSVDLTGYGFAKCASFPCTATGQFEDQSPSVFTAAYTISPAVATPEPSFTLPVAAVLLAGIVFVRRKKRFTKGDRRISPSGLQSKLLTSASISCRRQS